VTSSYAALPGNVPLENNPGKADSLSYETGGLDAARCLRKSGGRCAVTFRSPSTGATLPRFGVAGPSRRRTTAERVENGALHLTHKGVTMTTQTLSERNNVITFRGNPMTLVGPALHAGEPAPEFTLSSADLSPFTLKDAIADGAREALLIVVPSLDTPTCAVETSTFHKRLAEVPPDAAAFVVSLDLPFAQKRWAEANDAAGLTYLSDYREHAFGTAYGLLIKELTLLARAVIVIGKDATLKYVEIVPEVAAEPNYDGVFAVL
jgi:thiol peroxidase